jgi:hypothetical protein
VHISVASIPSNHVYVRHLSPVDPRTTAVRRLADPPAGGVPDAPWWPPVMLDPAWVDAHASAFDLMHIHFGFDALAPEELEALVDALRRNGRPLVLTVHDLRNPHHVERDLHDRQLDVLVHAAQALVTLTGGAADEVEQRWGRRPLVLPHPHVVPMEWLARPRKPHDGFVVGLHLKSLRAGMDPLPVLEAVVDGLRDLPEAHLRVDAHTDVMTAGYDRHAPAVEQRLRELEVGGRLELQVHDYFSDEQLWTYLQSLDVSVLPYRFGTHSGWLEACHDLGTAVLAPDCGYYAQQRPCHTYRTDPARRATSVARALRAARAAGPAPRAGLAERRTERAALAQEHERLYAAVLAQELTCTS